MNIKSEDNNNIITTWTTRDGNIIKISDMSDSHLMNTIKLIERKYTKTVGVYLTGPRPSGEMAQDAFDEEFDYLNEEGPNGYNEAYDFLVEEAARRGIDNQELRETRLLNLDLQLLATVFKKS